MKIARARHVVFEGNKVHDQNKGLWTDVASRNIDVLGNDFHHNGETAVHLEITDDVEVAGNRFWENGWDDPADIYGEAALKMISVRNASVHDNVFAWNEDGVLAMNSLRKHGVGNSEARFDGMHDVQQRDNTFLSAPPGDGRHHYATAWVKTTELDAVPRTPGVTYIDDADANVGGSGNAYWQHPDSAGTVWNKWLHDYNGQSLERFEATPGESDPSTLTTEEAAVALRSAGIPEAPEARASGD